MGCVRILFLFRLFGGCDSVGALCFVCICFVFCCVHFMFLVLPFVCVCVIALVCLVL